MNRVVLLIGAIVVVPLLVVLAVSFRYDPHIIESPLIGKPAPNFAMRDLEGRTFNLETLRGKPVVINFWATYCPPCIVEHPMLVAGARRYAGRAQLLGVIYQDEPGLIQRFIEERGEWGPSLIDPDGKVAIAYGVYGPPETFFIDSDGIIVEKIIGAVPPADFVRIIEEML